MLQILIFVIYEKDSQMKNKTILTVLCALVFVSVTTAQSVQDIIDLISTSNLQNKVSVLSGEEAAIINGTSQTIPTRFRTNNDLAADYIEEQFLAMDNLTVEVQNFNSAGKNVIATQLGKTNPDDIYLVCAHYDSVTTFCADDNASGTAAVIEIARVLSTQCTDNTIVYALWDEEENGLNGSNYYAQLAADTSNGNTRDNILAVINMDMIGYDGDAPNTSGDNDFDIDVRNIANSLDIVTDLQQIMTDYTFDLNPIIVNPGSVASDHARFWDQNYSAVFVGESWETNDQTPDYHTSGDRIDDIDFQYMTEITKLIAAYFTTKASLTGVDSSVTISDVNISANSTSGTYQWFNCDTNVPIAGETNQTYTPTVNGNYAVEMTNGTCTERSACVNFSTLSLENFTANEVKVYPSPVTSILKIDNFTQTEVQVTIYDISGKLVATKTSQNEHIDFKIEKNAAGVYFVKVASKTKSSIFKIVKE